MAGFKKIVLSGYYGYSNAGDELILKNILTGFKKYLPDIKILVLSQHSDCKYKSYGNIAYINRYNPLSILWSFISSDALVMGGGSLLQDISGYFTIYYYFILMGMAKLLGKKLIIFNQGIGPIKKGINKIIANVIFLNTDLIIVRDKYSKEFVEKITKNRKKIVLGADPIFNTIYPGREKTKNTPGKIGFSIRNWKNFPVKEKFIEIAGRLKTEGWICYNVPFHYPEDNLNSENIIKIEWSSPEQLFSIVCRFDVFIGMRLHSLMLGAISSLPMIGIDYDPKVRNFCDFMEFPCLEICDINIDNIRAKLDEVIKRGAGYSGKLKILNNRLELSWKVLKNFINKRGRTYEKTKSVPVCKLL